MPKYRAKANVFTGGKIYKSGQVIDEETFKKFPKLIQSRFEVVEVVQVEEEQTVPENKKKGGK